MYRFVLCTALSLICCFAVEISLAQETDSTEKSKQDKELEKLKKHPLFESFKRGDFVVTGSVENYKLVGKRPNDKGGAIVFHSITFQPKGQIRGNFFSVTDEELKLAKLKKPANWKVTAGLITKEKITSKLTKKGEPCIFVLQTMKASSMAGTVPVRILSACPATDENLKVAKAAARDK